MTLFDFPDELPVDVKLETLFNYYGLKERVNIDEEDKPMLVLALNAKDVVTVVIDDDGALLVEYADEPEHE